VLPRNNILSLDKSSASCALKVFFPQTR